MKKMITFVTPILLAGICCAQGLSYRPDTGRDNWQAALKSTFIPGWGQISKGHVTEGVITLTGEAVVVGGAVATYYWGQSVARQMRNDGGVIAIHTAHHDQYKALTTANHVLWGAAAALWLVNIYRAFVAEPQQRGTASIATSLISTPEATMPTIGFMFNLNSANNGTSLSTPPRSMRFICRYAATELVSETHRMLYSVGNCRQSGRRVGDGCRTVS